jgi:hypothetical protein
MLCIYETVFKACIAIGFMKFYKKLINVTIINATTYKVI